MATDPKKPAVDPAWAALHRKSAAALLSAERRALEQLRVTAAGVIHEAADAAEAAAAHDPKHRRLFAIAATKRAMVRLSATLETALAASRHQARVASLGRLSAELDLLRRQLVAAGIHEAPRVPHLSDSAEDGPAAHAAAASYTAAWGTAAVAAILAWERRTDLSLAAALRRTIPANDYRIRRIATTETARAFNDEHDEGVGYVATESKGAIWLPGLFRRWDATLDRVTCPICARLDGEIVMVGRSFSGGLVPGYVHPHCRCIGTLWFMPVRVQPGQTTPGHYTGLDDDEAA